MKIILRPALSFLPHLIAALCFLPLVTFAQLDSKKDFKPLLFQADKNNLQVLPQRFEYSLWDENRFSVGDVLIDSTQVAFKLAPVEGKKNQFHIRFSWPANLLKEGELTIKNNSGKTVFVAELNKETVHISLGTPLKDHETLRSDIASYSTTVDAKIVNDMKYLPFLVFCIYRKTEDTKLYLCSKELYISSQQGRLTVKPRNLNKKEAHVEINGATVGNQGIIYLNDRSEAVNFTAGTESGSFLEIETRRNDVDFKDIVENNNNLILTASGAEPADEKQVKKISATDWQIVLPKDRPVVYLKGDGDIPMRQEFNIKGVLPQEKFRPYTAANSTSKTYASSLTLQVTAPRNGQLKPNTQDSSANLEGQNRNFRWSLTDIPSGESRRYLSVAEGENNFVAGYDIDRGAPYILYLGVHYQLPSGLIFATVGGQWWIENFLFRNSSWNHFRWGFALDQRQHLTSKAEYAKVDITTGELLWRAHAGFNMIDPTWGLIIPLQMITAESDNTTMFGVGFFCQHRLQKSSFKFMTHMMNWAEIKLHYFPGSSNQNFKATSTFNLEVNAYKKLSEQSTWSLKYGAAFRQFKYVSPPTEEDIQLDLTAAAYWKF